MCDYLSDMRAEQVILVCDTCGTEDPEARVESRYLVGIGEGEACETCWTEIEQSMEHVQVLTKKWRTGRRKGRRK